VTGWILLGLIVIYVVVGNLLALRAFRYRIDPNEPQWGYQIWYRRYFTDEGQPLRRVAVRFFVVGAIAIGALWWLLA